MLVLSAKSLLTLSAKIEKCKRNQIYAHGSGNGSINMMPGVKILLRGAMRSIKKHTRQKRPGPGQNVPTPTAILL